AAMAHAIQRLAPRKDRVEELFRGTNDVTKKTSLRTLLDEYTSVLNDLQEAIDDWSYEGPEEESAGSAFGSSGFGGSAPAAPSTSTAVTAPPSGFLAFLKSLPVIGQILKALGL